LLELTSIKVKIEKWEWQDTSQKWCPSVPLRTIEILDVSHFEYMSSLEKCVAGPINLFHFFDVFVLTDLNRETHRTCNAVCSMPISN
jgi:hypothetical protein